MTFAECEHVQQNRYAADKCHRRGVRHVDGMWLCNQHAVRRCRDWACNLVIAAAENRRQPGDAFAQCAKLLKLFSSPLPQLAWDECEEVPDERPKITVDLPDENNCRPPEREPPAIHPLKVEDVQKRVEELCNPKGRRIIRIARESALVIALVEAINRLVEERR